MKAKFLTFIFLMSFTNLFAQNRSIWQTTPSKSNSEVKAVHRNSTPTRLYNLNIDGLKQIVANSPNRQSNGVSPNVIISIPNAEGQLERFKIFEASVMHPDLQARYPNIRSYAGQGIDDPTAIIRFSVSPNGFSSMVLSANKPASFIEPYTEDLNTYIVYNRAQRFNNSDPFECSVVDEVSKKMSGDISMQRNADDGILRTYRLAVSTTGEYTQYHGGTKAQALAAINTTMTRVNGIFEVDFNVNMVLIANTDDVIYTNAGSDPYGSSGQWNGQLQSTLTSQIGEANYDIGHLLAQGSNNGNAGCIGCVCVNGQKGSGWTNGSVPEGDFYDVDYVAHEMGHQFGANHTWTFGGNEGTNVQVEPGSGTTIMSYAGITGSTDVEPNVTPNFHAVSIEQVTDYVKTTSCQVNTNTGNSVPSVNAGANYTIPRGTPFILEGSATDADAGNVLSYVWEQMDENNASTTLPSTTATTGVAFRAYEPTSDSFRYFPRLQTIKAGATSWQWEAVPNVARTLNFRLTVRDNVAGGGTNNSDDMVVTVNGTAGPFVVNSPNTNVTWNAGTTQTVTWNVAGTTGNGVNAANVDIFLSTDGGDTYPIALASGVPNDGSHDILVPNNQGTTNRVMVRGSNNIFFDISNANFTIAGQVVCNPDVPTGLAASNVATTTATLSWDAVPGATYDLRYRETGTSTWTTNAVTGISTNLSGLTALTQYEAQVRSKCSGGSNSAYSSSVTFTTLDVQLNYCGSTSTNVNDEYISRVQLNTIDNSSGAQFYSDFTGISTTLTKDTQYTITITPTWTGTLYNEGYSVWIDYNRDGDFTDAGEQVFTQSPTQTTPVSGSFTIPSGAVENSTRMRVSMKYNDIPDPCETFTWGEVEDYTVIIEGSGPDTEAPVITLNGASTINLNVGDTYTEQGATAIDNVDGDISGNIVIGGDTVNTNIGGTYIVTYNVSDAAGNAATEVTRTVNVIPDTTPPVITLNGSATVNLNIGGTYTELGATATDNIDGDISGNIVIGGDTVNTNLAGTYIVTYNVSDAAGNAAAEVTRTVNVAADTTPPVISLIGNASISLELGQTYTEQGATATDNIDGDISANIVIGGDTVNTNLAGTYIVTYNVSDAAGNAATEVTRTVTVNPDTTPPVIVLNGSSPVNLTVGDTYTELGATATDNIDGDISGSIVIGGDTVNTSVAGTYIVTYNVSDTAGNAANQVNRTVNVSDPSSGCSGGISTYPYSEGFEGGIGAWSQSGADDLDWLVDAGGTPSNNTGPSSATEGSNYIYVEASVNGTGYPNKRAIITSPCFDLSGLTNPNFDFSYHMFGASDMGTIDLEISDDDGASWTSIWNQSGNQGNQWLDVSIDLSSYAGSNVQLRFNRFVGSTWQADIAIDDINLLEPAAPTCDDGIQNGDEEGVDCGGSFCAPCSTSNVVLNEGFFETGWDSWIDGGNDCARVNSANSFEGNFSIRIRDNSGVASAMTLSNIDVTSFSEVEVDFYFYVESMENNEDFWLRFFDGSTWITVETWVSGGNIENNNFYNATVTIPASTYNFASNSGFRFQCDASGNGDRIFIDQVTITGISGTSRGNNDKLVIVGSRDIVDTFEEDFKLYPNPVKGNILNIELPEGDKFTYRIIDIMGKTIMNGSSEGIINIDRLDAGIYMIEINDGEDIMMKRFVRN